MQERWRNAESENARYKHILYKYDQPDSEDELQHKCPQNVDPQARFTTRCLIKPLLNATSLPAQPAPVHSVVVPLTAHALYATAI